LQTIGILHAGELGAALGRLLAARGHRVVTCCSTRSPATAGRARDAGFEVLADEVEVCRASDIVVSLVPPAAALELAHGLTPALRGVLFVDANSVAPATAAAVRGAVEAAGAAFVDASIHGLAARLAEQGTCYLSGARADEVARVLEGAIAVQVVGAEPGTASMMKMLLGGMSKGLCSLFLELARAAEHAGLLDEFVGSCRQYYPGVMTALERLLPTVPRHAARRADEMGELAHTLEAAGLEPGLAREAQRTLARIARSTDGTTMPPADAGLADLIRAMVGGQLPGAAPSIVPDPGEG
jgi:3-hydroxyisobutyrate dehydrogenase-like beta-hydroxyacid dehydrogenase